MLRPDRVLTPYALTLAAACVVAFCTGWGFNTVGIPLGWLIGSMFATAVFSLAWRDPQPPVVMRATSQMVVASAVALNITPSSAAAIVGNLPLMLASAIALVAMGGAIAVFLVRVARLDRSTALFGALPGGATEMAIVAMQFGGHGATVAVAQTCRIAFVVTTLPPILGLLGNKFVDFTKAPVVFDPVGLALVLAIAVVSALLMARTRITNPYFLGPLFVISGLSFAGLPLPLGPVPGMLIAVAQVGLGMALGAMFNRAMMRSIRRIIVAVISVGIGLIAFCLLFSLVLATMVGLPFGELVLATSPASVTEMALTATGMSFDPALVTAFHVIRIMVVIPLAQPIFALFKWLVPEADGPT